MYAEQFIFSVTYHIENRALKSEQFIGTEYRAIRVDVCNKGPKVDELLDVIDVVFLSFVIFFFASRVLLSSPLSLWYFSQELMNSKFFIGMHH